MKRKSHRNSKIMTRIGDSISNESFIFNLGRLWQEVESERWDGAEYMIEFIKEVCAAELKKKYSKELAKLEDEINNQNLEKVDRVLRRILKW